MQIQLVQKTYSGIRNRKLKQSVMYSYSIYTSNRAHDYTGQPEGHAHHEAFTSES